MNTYQFDGHMTYHHSGAAPVYAPNSGGRPWADETGAMEDGWEADGAMVRSSYILRPDDDDFIQPGTLVRDVFNDAERQSLVDTVAGALLGACAARCLSAPSSTGNRSTRTSADASRTRCAVVAPRNPPPA